MPQVGSHIVAETPRYRCLVCRWERHSQAIMMPKRKGLRAPYVSGHEWESDKTLALKLADFMVLHGMETTARNLKRAVA